MASSGPNIQLELRLAEMARMNDEIRRRHLEVEADKRRAQREGQMVTAAQRRRFLRGTQLSPGFPAVGYKNVLGI